MPLPFRSSEPSLELRAYRVLCFCTALLIPAFGYLYHALDPTVVDPAALRWGLAALPATLLALSFYGPQRRREISILTGVLVYLVVAWTVGLLYVNRLDPAYAVGFMLVLTTAGVAGVGSHQTRATALCLGLGVAAAVGVALAVPAPEMSPWLFAACVVANGLVIFIGASLRLRTRARLLASESRYRTVFEHTTDGVFLVDAQTLHFIQANRAYLALTGYGAEELRALRLYDVLVTRPDTIDRDVRHVLAEHHLALGEQQHRRRDGSTVALDIGLNLFEHDGRSVLCFTAHDLTEQKRMLAELGEAKERAEEMLRLKSGFLNNMSHELRTPLVSILGFAEVLSDELDDENQEIAETITRSARRLHETLNSVLDLAQLQGGEVQLKPEVVDVSDEARETLLLLRPLAEAKDLTLRFQPAEDARGARGPRRVPARPDEPPLERRQVHRRGQHRDRGHGRLAPRFRARPRHRHRHPGRVPPTPLRRVQAGVDGARPGPRRQRAGADDHEAARRADGRADRGREHGRDGQHVHGRRSPVPRRTWRFPPRGRGP